MITARQEKDEWKQLEHRIGLPCCRLGGGDSGHEASRDLYLVSGRRRRDCSQQPAPNNMDGASNDCIVFATLASFHL